PTLPDTPAPSLHDAPSDLPLAYLFDAVVASDDVARNKPHPDGILRALELLDARPDEAAYVGDSPFDVEAAKRAGVYAVAVGWGGGRKSTRLNSSHQIIWYG